MISRQIIFTKKQNLSVFNKTKQILGCFIFYILAPYSRETKIQQPNCGVLGTPKYASDYVCISILYNGAYYYILPKN